MLSTNQVCPGLRLRSLQQIGKGTAWNHRTVDLVREPKAGWQWSFTVHWQRVRAKERYSAYFRENDLVLFELAPEGSEWLPQMVQRGAKWRPEQLSLPFSEDC
jgi:hypothetical protein